MLIIIIAFISYILEMILKYYLPNFTEFYTHINPMFFVSFLIIYIICFYKNKKSFYFLITSSLIYDFFFGSISFLYTLIFILIYYFIHYVSNKFHHYLLIDIIIFIVSLIMFIILKYLILSLIGYNYSVSFLLNEILKIIIINTVYGAIIYYFLGIKLRKN